MRFKFLDQPKRPKHNSEIFVWPPPKKGEYINPRVLRVWFEVVDGVFPLIQRIIMILVISSLANFDRLVGAVVWGRDEDSLL